MTGGVPLRVAILNQYFPPDTSATANVFGDLAAEFQRRGHNVDVICGRPSYGIDPRANDLLGETGSALGVRVRRVPSTAFDRASFVGRVVNYVSFLIASSLMALVTRRPDVVVAGTDPPLAVVIGLLLARGRPVIYSLQDLHPEAAAVFGWISRGWLYRFWDRIHTLALRRAAVVIVLGDRMAERLRAKGVPTDRVRVVENGARVQVGVPAPDVVSALRGPASFLVVHAGNIGGAGAWNEIAAAASMVEGKAEFLFVGEGAHEDALRRSGLRVIGFQPAAEIASVMDAGDLQLVSMRPDLDGLIVPSKMYTILAHGRPLLAVAPRESEVARVIAKWHCGILADPADPNDIASKVEWAVEHRDALPSMAANAKEAARFFDRSSCTRKFVDTVERTVDRWPQTLRRSF